MNTTTTDKRFATLQAQFALTGHRFHKSEAGAEPVTYLAERWGLVGYLPTLDDADLFLKQIGGAHG